MIATLLIGFVASLPLAHDSTVTVDSLHGEVYSLLDDNSNFYIAGRFNSVGGVAASNIARFDGSSWHAVGDATTPRGGAIYTIAKDSSGAILVGGIFDSIGDLYARNIARFDGSWQPLGRGLNDTVFSIATTHDSLVAGGAFTHSDTIELEHLASWKPASGWSTVGGERLNGTVYFVQAKPTVLRFGGAFDTASGPSWTPYLGSIPHVALMQPPAPVYDYADHRRSSFICFGAHSRPIITWIRIGDYDYIGTVNDLTPSLNGSALGVAAIDRKRAIVWGTFSSINGARCPAITLYNGANWKSINQIDGQCRAATVLGDRITFAVQVDTTTFICQRRYTENVKSVIRADPTRVDGNSAYWTYTLLNDSTSNAPLEYHAGVMGVSGGCGVSADDRGTVAPGDSAVFQWSGGIPQRTSCSSGGTIFDNDKSRHEFDLGKEWDSGLQGSVRVGTLPKAVRAQFDDEEVTVDVPVDQSYLATFVSTDGEVLAERSLQVEAQRLRIRYSEIPAGSQFLLLTSGGGVRYVCPLPRFR